MHADIDNAIALYHSFCSCGIIQLKHTSFGIVEGKHAMDKPLWDMIEDNAMTKPCHGGVHCVTVEIKCAMEKPIVEC